MLDFITVLNEIKWENSEKNVIYRMDFQWRDAMKWLNNIDVIGILNVFRVDQRDDDCQPVWMWNSVCPYHTQHTPMVK